MALLRPVTLDLSIRMSRKTPSLFSAPVFPLECTTDVAQYIRLTPNHPAPDYCILVLDLCRGWSNSNAGRYELSHYIASSYIRISAVFSHVFHLLCCNNFASNLLGNRFLVVDVCSISEEPMVQLLHGNCLALTVTAENHFVAKEKMLVTRAPQI